MKSERPLKRHKLFKDTLKLPLMTKSCKIKNKIKIKHSNKKSLKIIINGLTEEFFNPLQSSCKVKSALQSYKFKIKQIKL